MKWQRYKLDFPANSGAFVPYNIHKSLERMFRGEKYLWRLDGKVLSTTAGKEPTENLAYWKTLSSINVGFDVGKLYQFKVLTYPIKRTKSGDKRLYSDFELYDYIGRKFVDCGGKLIDAKIIDIYKKEYDSFDKYNFPLYSVDFDIVIRVDDSSRLEAFLKRGIGRQKAFGCGMLAICE